MRSIITFATTLALCFNCNAQSELNTLAKGWWYIDKIIYKDSTERPEREYTQLQAVKNDPCGYEGGTAYEAWRKVNGRRDDGKYHIRYRSEPDYFHILEKRGGHSFLVAVCTQDGQYRAEMSISSSKAFVLTGNHPLYGRRSIYYKKAQHIPDQ